MPGKPRWIDGLFPPTRDGPKKNLSFSSRGSYNVTYRAAITPGYQFITPINGRKSMDISLGL